MYLIPFRCLHFENEEKEDFSSGSLLDIFFISVTIWGVVLAERVCYFSQEPDASQSGRLRWVMPGSQEDRCACTSTRPGPVNVQPVRWSHPPFYTDTPIFTDDQEDIHDYFGCPNPCQPNPCRYNGKCKKHGDSFQCDCKRGINGERCDKPKDCHALYDARIRDSGVYTIYPSQYPEGLQVYCDGNGWIVFQDRFDGSVNFTRNWTEYRDGFGDLWGEFWLGNEKLRQLTSTKEWALEIELMYDDLSGSIDQFTIRWPFRVVGDDYRLVVEGLTDGFPFLSIDTPRAFSTYDRDNDDSIGINCAEVGRGGWWFGDCASQQDSGVNLNGEYSLLDHPDYYIYQENLAIVRDDGVKLVYNSQMKLRRFTPNDCPNLYHFGIEGSGVYTIYPLRRSNRMRVYCDMDTEPKDWIVFQKRFDGSVNFTRNWTDYKDGFGDLSGEFWLGNEKLRLLTSTNNWKLRVDLEDDKGMNETITVDSFSIQGRDFTLDRDSPASDFPQFNKQKFSTYDKDNDDVEDSNCAAKQKGGWWFGNCCDAIQCSLNGKYHRGGSRGFQWAGWTNHNIVKCEMKLRRY
ncbi:uncharacterized protein LOC119731864 [Patiria miniata]|uniref:Uncharacterized protein n=1 Tax=Patiria miniata TaxID=46514 RepID=A0A914AC80_PATMI|nr:uncharacterized protein LOC119731864 [Patiria miniata]